MSAVAMTSFSQEAWAVGRDGTPVGTAVHITVEGDHAFVRTFDRAGKLKRSGSESIHAGQALARKYPLVHGILVPLVHRLRGNKTMHMELVPIAA